VVWDSSHLEYGSEDGYRLTFFKSGVQSATDSEKVKVTCQVEEFNSGASSRPGGLADGADEAILAMYVREPIHVGVEVDRSTGFTKIYAVGESDTSEDDDLWAEANKLFEYTDATHIANVRCGLYAYRTQIRADKIELLDVGDRVYTADDWDVAIQGQLRTITPLLD